MPTPTYSVNTPPLTPDKIQGQIISLANRDYRYCSFEATAGADLPAGVFLTMVENALTGNTLVVPSATGSKLFGVSIFRESLVMKYNDTDGYYYYEEGDPVSMIEKGDIVMYSETTSAIGDPVFVRHTADGGNTRIGAIANATGTGLDEVTWATYLDSLDAPGLVRVSLRK